MISNIEIPNLGPVSPDQVSINLGADERNIIKYFMSGDWEQYFLIINILINQTI